MWQDMGAGSLQAAMGSPQAMNALLLKGDVKPIVGYVHTVRWLAST